MNKQLKTMRLRTYIKLTHIKFDSKALIVAQLLKRETLTIFSNETHSLTLKKEKLSNIKGKRKNGTENPSAKKKRPQKTHGLKEMTIYIKLLSSQLYTIHQKIMFYCFCLSSWVALCTATISFPSWSRLGALRLKNYDTYYQLLACKAFLSCRAFLETFQPWCAPASESWFIVCNCCLARLSLSCRAFLSSLAALGLQNHRLLACNGFL